MTDIPSTIGRYQVVSRIARGGMGTLYLALDPLLDRQIAIKILTGDDDELRERFAREARSVARLRHPHIVTIFDVGESDGRPFIAMEYIQGQTLATLIGNRVPLTTARKLEIVEDLCDGLAFAHKTGIVHRDIKPANIMLEPNGTLKILDFGIARATKSSAMTHAGMLIGTLNYMSPEQVAGQAADNRSDIYAVGAVMYELLSYRQAFPGGLTDGILHRLLNQSPEPLERLCPGLDPEIARIVARSLEKDPRDRYQDLGSMLNDVRSSRAALPAVEHGLEDTTVTTVSVPRLPVRTPVPTPELSRRAVDRDELVQRRAKRIEAHVESAERLFATGDYDAGITECEQALMLDGDDARALELLDRARVVLDERQAAEVLAEAADEIKRGALASALAKIDRAAALHPSSPRVAELRKAVEDALAARERARQRAEAIRVAMERAHEKFDQGLFQEAIAAADEVLTLDPELSEAKGVKSESLDAIAAHERELLDRRAREAVRDARRLFVADEHTAAIDLLTRFEPSHPLIAQTIEQLRAESARIVAQRQLEAEQRARRERIAAELKNVRVDLGAGEFASALDRLRVLQEAEGSLPETVSLYREAEAGLAAQEQAARTAKELAAHIARAAGLLARQDPSGALASVDAALALDPAHKAARALRAKIDDRLHAAAELREAEERRIRERDQAVAAAIAKANQATSHQAAIAALGEALDLVPDHAEATALLEGRQHALAREQAERRRLLEMETARQGQLEQMLVAAREALGRGDLPGAREAAVQIRELDPGNRAAGSLLDDIELAEEQRRTETPVVSEVPVDVGDVPPASGVDGREQIGRPTAIEPFETKPRPAAGTETPQPTATRAPARRPPAKSRSAYPILGGVAALVVVAAIAYVFWGRSPAPPARTGAPGSEPLVPPISSPTDQQAAPRQGTEVPPVPSPPPVDLAGTENARVEQQVDDLRKLAREQLARGDRQQALATMRTALKLRPNDAQLNTLLSSALTNARATLRQAHDAATGAGEAAVRSSNYREGIRREGEIAGLARSGKSDEAIRVAWLATDLFDKAATEAKRSSPPAAAPSAPPATAPSAPVEPRPTPERPEQTPPPVVTAPPPAPAPPPVVRQPPTPPAETTPPARPSPAPVAGTSPPVVSDEQAIRAILQAYVDGYSRRDAGAVKRVFPAVKDQALEKDFSAMRAQQVQIEGERIEITGATATVSCSWTTNFVPKVGAPGRGTAKVTLRLQKSGGTWVIVDRR